MHVLACVRVRTLQEVTSEMKDSSPEQQRVHLGTGQTRENLSMKAFIKIHFCASTSQYFIVSM